MDALGLSAVLEEDESRLGKGAISFRQRALLNTLFRRATHGHRHWGRCGRSVGIALSAPPSGAANAGFRLRSRGSWRLPLRVSDRLPDPAVWLARQNRLLAIDPQ